MQCPDFRVVQRRLPLIVAYSILLVTYIVFVATVEHETLVVRGDISVFLRQLLVHNILFFLASYSLYIVSSRPAGSPSRHDAQESNAARPGANLSPEDRDLAEADFRGITLEQWKASKTEQYERDNNQDDDDVPLVNLMTRRAVNEEEYDTSESLPPTLTVKKSSGGARWCRKCGASKPDRCHHCSSCGTCILGMDHHCLWISGCVGYRNRKSFLLFLVYGTLYAAYSAFEAGLVCVIFFNSSPSMNDGPEVEVKPVIWIFLALTGIVFTLSLGPFAMFHFYLVSRNLTTLEHLRPAYPNIRLPDQPAAPRMPSYPPSTGQPDRNWKPDHMFSRDERRLAKRISESINPYDLGWVRNLKQVFDPDDEGISWRCFWPGGPSGSSSRLAGQTFPYSQRALDQLREETARIRRGTNYDSHFDRHSSGA